MNIFELLNYDFIVRAYVAGSFVAILCAMIGLLLVLRRMSLIGDGLSHVSFGAIALGLFLGFYPFYVAVPIVIIFSFLILKLTERAKLYGDAAVGIVSSFGIALGVILASLSKGFNVDLFSYLFGNILAISAGEVYLSVTLSVLVLLIIVFFYNDLFATTFDEEYAKVSGVKTKSVNNILFFLTAITVVLAIKVVGIMLVSALLVVPAVSALQISKSFKSGMFFASFFAVLSVLIGVTASFIFDVPAGGMIVMINLSFFALAYFLNKI